MKPLSDNAKMIIDEAERAEHPSEAERNRMKKRVFAAVAGGGAAVGAAAALSAEAGAAGVTSGAGAVAGTSAAGATGAAAAGATAATGAAIGVAGLSKVLAVVVVAGAVGTVAVIERSPPDGVERPKAQTESLRATDTPEGGHNELVPTPLAPEVQPPAPEILVPAKQEPVRAAPAAQNSDLPASPRHKARVQPQLPTKPAEPAVAEAALLQQATQAQQAGDAEAVLLRTAEHQRRFPESELAPERSALRLMALCQLGRSDEASELRRKLKLQYPNSYLWERIVQSCR